MIEDIKQYEKMATLSSKKLQPENKFKVEMRKENGQPSGISNGPLSPPHPQTKTVQAAQRGSDTMDAVKLPVSSV